MDVAIRRLREAEVGSAGRLLARAFADDPLIGTHLGGRQQGSIRHRLAYPAFFRAAVRDAIATGQVDAAFAEGGLAGVAAWVDPEGRPSTALRRRLDARLAGVLYPAGVAAIDAGFAEIAGFHPSVPHRYLAFVGVEPEAQGGGIGSRLLAPVIAAADADGMPCYLETPFEATLPFYRRLGFEVERALPMTFGLGPLWTMVRRPQPR